MNAFCASENFDAFIVFRSSPDREITAENSTFERSSFQGSEHSLVLSIASSTITSYWGHRR
ncbi:hypothetical protein EB815_32030 [Mesorhizobium loti]|nr:hypothetical protein EB815_32030 [Mesorhizobium loti]